MSSLVKLFIAIIALIAPLNNLVESALSSAIDLDKILDVVQQEQLSSIVNNPHRAERSQDSSDSDSDSDNYFSYIEDSDKAESNRYARLRKERIIDLIDKVAHEKTNRVINDGRNIRNERPKYRQNNMESRIENRGNVQAHVLEHLLSKSFNEEDRKRKLRAPRPKKRLTPNRLTGSISRNDIKDYDRNVASGLQDYSKVYIVLNPQAVRNSKNKNSLNDMISKVLSLSSQNSKSDRHGKMPRRYKGFVVKNGQSRRSRRESKEEYVPKDTMEHAPKRSRSGNAGGHTAIPYIKHRGNVYERDD